MKAFHTLRTHIEQGPVRMRDFELFTLLLSALEWRKHNGEIALLTDHAGADYLQNCGLSEVWDEPEIIFDDESMKGIDERVFWAGAKIFALQKQHAPCVMMDLDFIVWRTLDFTQYDGQTVVIHREPVGNEVYPEKAYFQMDKSWTDFDDTYWSLEACNTAFAYFGDAELLQYYCKKALLFMHYAQVREPDLPYMVFAEQRLLAMCAKQMGQEIQTFSSLNDLFGDKQREFTHVWGQKETFRQNNSQRAAFCWKCAERLQHDFPDWAEKLQKQSWAHPYLSA